MSIKRIFGKCSILFLFFFLSGCIIDDQKIFVSSDYLEALVENDIEFRSLPIESDPVLNKFSGVFTHKNTYKVDESAFMLIECMSPQLSRDIQLDKNSSAKIFHNQNLALIVRIETRGKFINCFQSLKEPLSYKQTGIFIYPLTICLLLAVFIITERTYSLRPGLTFPRKVEKL